MKCLDCGDSSPLIICDLCHKRSEISDETFTRTAQLIMQLTPEQKHYLKQEYIKVPRIQVDASETETTTTFPAGTIAVSHISAIDTTPSKLREDGTGGNPMATIEWTVDEGPYKGRRVGFHRIMLGGKTQKGGAMPLFQLFDLIEAVKAPWAADSKAPLVWRPFKRVKTDHGTELRCDPDTGKKVAFPEINMPEDFINKRALVKYGIRKQDGSDREFNEVLEVKPLA